MTLVYNHFNQRAYVATLREDNGPYLDFVNLTLKKPADSNTIKNTINKCMCYLMSEPYSYSYIVRNTQDYSITMYLKVQLTTIFNELQLPVVLDSFLMRSFLFNVDETTQKSYATHLYNLECCWVDCYLCVICIKRDPDIRGGELQLYPVSSEVEENLTYMATCLRPCMQSNKDVFIPIRQGDVIILDGSVADTQSLTAVSGKGEYTLVVLQIQKH